MKECLFKNCHDSDRCAWHSHKSYGGRTVSTTQTNNFLSKLRHYKDTEADLNDNKNGVLINSKILINNQPN